MMNVSLPARNEAKGRQSTPATTGVGRLTRGMGIVAVMLLLAVSWVLVEAADPPHWTSSSIIVDCTSQCHTLHNALGGQLTAADDNVNLCQSCHNSAGLAGGMPMDSAHAAIPGTTGTSHGFSVPTTSADLGTHPPLDGQMSLRLPDDRVVCSTCHDQHAATVDNGGRARISPPVQVVDLDTGTDTVSSSGSYTGTVGVWYLVEIDTAGDQGTATFRWSKDNGTSWMAELVGAGNGTPVALDFGVEVTLTSAAADFLVGERWEFTASYPFLRAPLDAGDNTIGDKYCRDCHRDWVMTHDSAGGTREYDGNRKSHPVGVTLNANGKGYDRSVPLDGNGGDQGVGGDANPTNDLVLDAGGRVQCLTCHGVHGVDSNTLTIDGVSP